MASVSASGPSPMNSAKRRSAQSGGATPGAAVRSRQRSSAEVVNMQPPAAMLKAGINALPTMGDGRQSGTSGSPSILNVSPEAAVGGGLALLQTGDRIRIDLNTHKVDVLLPEGEMDRRRAAWKAPQLLHKTPWEEIYRSMVGQLGSGGCLEPATLYLNILETRGESRDNH